MKKILSIALSALLVASMALSTSATIEGANSKTVKATIKAAAETPVLDGVIGEYEYAKIDTPAADMLYGGGDAVEKALSAYPFELYAAYDKDYVYIAIKTKHEAHKNENDATMSTIWNSDGIQIAGAKADVSAADKAIRTEVGYALSSNTGAILYNTGVDGLLPCFYNELAVINFHLIKRSLSVCGLCSREFRPPAGIWTRSCGINNSPNL